MPDDHASDQHTMSTAEQRRRRANIGGVAAKDRARP
jgi:hypothetical protein